MNNDIANMKELEFNCMLAISSDAFDIHGFIADFIKGEKMNSDHYAFLLNTACDLLDEVRNLRDIRQNIRSELENTRFQRSIERASLLPVNSG